MSTMTDYEIREDGVIVSAKLVVDSVQPWSGKPCFAYRVDLSIRNAGEYQEYAYGSQKDYEDGVDDQEQDMARLVVSDLLSAYDDPEEFWQLATGEPDLSSLDKARHIIKLIDYAAKAGPMLEQLRTFASEE